MYDDALPLKSDQQLLFSQLLDSIEFVERSGSAAWSLTILANGFRLNVGQVEALTWTYTYLEPGEGGNDEAMAFSDIRILVVGDDCERKFKGSKDQFSLAEMAYKSVGRKHWCLFCSFQCGKNGVPNPGRDGVVAQLTHFRENHHEFLTAACTTSTGKLRQKSNFSQHHCESLYQYALSVVAGAVVDGNHADHDPHAGKSELEQGGDAF
jgi:hypothetical protein